MTRCYLEKRDPAHHQQRFYLITMTPTLFGSWALIREWGRIGQPGTVRETGYDTEAAAQAAGEAPREREERRGYRTRT
jgi:predicted DNA-binding WGR domain protein